MLGVEKTMVSDSVMYKDASIQHQVYNANEIARAAHGLAVTNAKFLSKFNYGTDGNDRIVDMELSDDLLESLYDALIDGHEKLIQKKKKQDEQARRKFNQNSVNQIKRVKYDKPWTIVWWADGEVTRSKCDDTDVYSEAAGFNACVAKHYFQTAGAYNKVLKTYCKNDGDGDKSQYEQDYQAGYDYGYNIGIKLAKTEKYDAMSREYDNGRNLGYEEGYDDGYAAAEIEAYNDGYEEGQKYERSLIEEEKDTKN